MHRLDDVNALHRTVLRGQTASNLDVAVDDGEEDDGEDRPDDGTGGDAPPEDRAQSDFAEPEPIDVVAQEDNKGNDKDDQHRQPECDEPTPMREIGSTRTWLSKRRHVVHGRPVYSRQAGSGPRPEITGSWIPSGGCRD